MKYILKKYGKYMLVLSVGIISFVSMYLYSYNSKNKVKTDVSVKESVTKKVADLKVKKEDAKTVFVDVKGAVNTPGVYEIEEGKRIIDAINSAGGLASNANTINLNLSKKVEDEMYIIVYTKNEIYNYKKENTKGEVKCASNECICPDINNDACISKSNVTAEQDERIEGKISINTATKEELMTLSGIGEAKANAIIEYRNQNGLFKQLEDIKNVSGIGDAAFNKIKDNITL